MKICRYLIPVVVSLSTLPICSGEGTPTKTPATIPAPTPKKVSSVMPTVSIAHWKGDRKAAITFTFDDQQASHTKLVIPLFKKYDYRCTFYICGHGVGPKKRTTWEEWKAAVKDGFEVGSHTKMHGFPSEPAARRDAIEGNYELILEKTGVAPLTFAFPGGSMNNDTRKYIKASKHIDYRRRYLLDETGNKIKTQWARENLGERDLNATNFPKQIARALNHEKIWNGAKISWILAGGHDVSPKMAKGMEEVLAYIKKNDHLIWCTTYANATLYEKERDLSEIKVTKEDDTCVSFTLTNTLDKKIYNMPLTIIIQANEGASKILAVQNGKPLPTKADENRILVDVIPGPEPVTVSWDIATPKTSQPARKEAK